MSVGQQYLDRSDTFHVNETAEGVFLVIRIAPRIHYDTFSAFVPQYSAALAEVVEIKIFYLYHLLQFSVPKISNFEIKFDKIKTPFKFVEYNPEI